jgi:hypothetical protein
VTLTASIKMMIEAFPDRTTNCCTTDCPQKAPIAAMVVRNIAAICMPESLINVFKLRMLQQLHSKLMIHRGCRYDTPDPELNSSLHERLKLDNYHNR